MNLSIKSKLKNTFTTKNIAGMAVFCALSFAVYFLEFPIFPATPFLKIDFSNVFCMLGGFMYGPIGGIIVLVIKEALHIPFGSTAGIGEMVNVFVGLFFIFIPSFVYERKKGIKTVIITLICGSVLATCVALLSNKFISFPLYDRIFKISETGITFEKVVWFILAFNIIKFVAVSLLTILLYKKLSYFFKKINLQSTGDSENMKEIISKSSLETEEIAFNYAKTLKEGDVVILSGELGAGKTQFVKGVAKYFGLDNVTSPTYAYLNVYGDKLYHYDCYRLSCGEDAESLGLTDYFNGKNICLIEWAENIKDVLPKNTKKVEIIKISNCERKIIL